MERLFPDSWGAYFTGKRAAEAAVESHFGAQGAVLKPGIIYTSSLAEAREQAALGLKEAKMPNVVGIPMAALLGTPPARWAAGALGPVGDFLAPPSSVAVTACDRPNASDERVRTACRGTGGWARRGLE